MITITEFLKGSELQPIYNGKTPTVHTAQGDFIFRNAKYPDFEVSFLACTFYVNSNGGWTLLSYDFKIYEGQDGSFIDYPDQDVNYAEAGKFDVSDRFKAFKEWLVENEF